MASMSVFLKYLRIFFFFFFYQTRVRVSYFIYIFFVHVWRAPPPFGTTWQVLYIQMHTKKKFDVVYPCVNFTTAFGIRMQYVPVGCKVQFEDPPPPPNMHIWCLLWLTVVISSCVHLTECEPSRDQSSAVPIFKPAVTGQSHVESKSSAWAPSRGISELCWSGGRSFVSTG